MLELSDILLPILDPLPFGEDRIYILFDIVFVVANIIDHLRGTSVLRDSDVDLTHCHGSDC